MYRVYGPHNLSSYMRQYETTKMDVQKSSGISEKDFNKIFLGTQLPSVRQAAQIAYVYETEISSLFNLQFYEINWDHQFKSNLQKYKIDRKVLVRLPFTVTKNIGVPNKLSILAAINNFTRKDLSEIIGVSTTMISGYYVGRFELSVGIAHKLSTLFGFSVEDVFDTKGEIEKIQKKTGFPKIADSLDIPF